MLSFWSVPMEEVGCHLNPAWNKKLWMWERSQTLVHCRSAKVFLTLYFASWSKVRLSHFPPTAKGNVRQTVMSYLAFWNTWNSQTRSFYVCVLDGETFLTFDVSWVFIINFHVAAQGMVAFAVLQQLCSAYQNDKFTFVEKSTFICFSLGEFGRLGMLSLIARLGSAHLRAGRGCQWDLRNVNSKEIFWHFLSA